MPGLGRATIPACRHATKRCGLANGSAALTGRNRPDIADEFVQSRELVDRVEGEPFRLRSPDFADVFVRGQTVQCLQPAGVVTGGYVVAKVRPELLMILTVETFHYCFFDGAICLLDLTICRRMVGLCQPTLDTMYLTDHVEADWAGIDLVSVSGLICELDTIVSDYNVDPIWPGPEKVLEELPRSFSISFVDQLDHREPTGSVTSNREIQPIVGKTIPRIVF